MGYLWQGGAYAGIMHLENRDFGERFWSKAMRARGATTTGRRAFTLIELPAVRKRGGLAFTLIELLVVIAIIALLVTLLVPALSEAKRHAKVVICSTNLRAYATGLTTYSAEDDKNEYPQNTSWTIHFPWSQNYGYPPAHEWLDQYLEMVCGGNGDIMWCPLDRDMRPGPKSTYYYDVDAYTDPRYGDVFFYLHWHGSNSGYWIDYIIPAAFSPAGGGWDWSHSGNGSPEGTPPMRPATSRDVILADLFMSDGDYIINHADVPRDYTTFRENNAAYSDCHVETRFNEITSLSPWPHWDEHYIQAPWTTYWLY